MNPRRIVLCVLCVLTSLAAPRPAAAASRVEVSEAVEGKALAAVERVSHPAGARPEATVLVFFRPQHPYSVEALRRFGGCVDDVSARPVRYAAVVSSSWSAEEVRATVAEAGLTMPVVVDQGDALYGRFGVQVFPAVVVLDGARRLVAHEPYRSVQFCDRVRGKIQYALGEIDLDEVRRTEDPVPLASAAPAVAPVVSTTRFLVGDDEDAAPMTMLVGH